MKGLKFVDDVIHTQVAAVAGGPWSRILL